MIVFVHCNVSSIANDFAGNPLGMVIVILLFPCFPLSFFPVESRRMDLMERSHLNEISVGICSPSSKQ